MSHYRLVRRLGAGGMGDVFLADDLTLKRPVAIKFLLSAPDVHARKRLLIEARAAAALDHPGICAVHEIGADQFLGDFIVLQYVDGEPLNVRLARGPLPPAEALTICARIADALRVAHARGIVHRDLKPHNVMLTSSGEPKLLDFGIAKYLATGPEAANADTSSQLTHPLVVIGTPSYMAPEQVRHQPVDQRTDLFALGCVLYECLTSRRAFDGETLTDIKASVLHHTPPLPSSLVPAVTADHDALVARLLQKNPADRFQSAAEALTAIAAVQPIGFRSTDIRSDERFVLWPRSRRQAILVASASAVALTALVIWQGPWLHRLPAAPSEAVAWYSRGVEALQEGRFATARLSLDEAVRLSPNYALAYLRLAAACGELDDALGANAALVRAAAVIPSGTRLRQEEELRLRAVRASVMRDHAVAIDAYTRLATLHSNDASPWLDLGRAQEAAGRRSEAQTSYEHALQLDRQNAAARLRLGVLHVQMTNLDDGTRDLDEAIRLYHAAGQKEGEVEALIRKGELLLNAGRNAEARSAIDQTMPLIDPQDTFHRARARFALARLTAVDGQYSAADAVSRETVDEATAAGLYATASEGLSDFGYTLTVRRQFDEAAQVLARAADLAGKHGARRAEMRAGLQRASMLIAEAEFQQGIDASVEPLRFYAEQHYPRSEADGKNIVSRAYEGLERYDDAAKLSAEVLALAESMKDDALTAVAMDNVAGQLASQGRLVEALAYRERLEAIHRAQKNNLALPYDLNNHAELLIRLGRAREADALLDEVTRKAAEGIESFKTRTRRTAVLRAMRASTERRWNDVETFTRVAIAMPDPAAKPDTNSRWGSLLLEHARAQQGRSRMPAAGIISWVEETSAPAVRREIAYWVVQTLLARGERDRARAIAGAVAADPVAAANSELRWRMLTLSGAAENLAREPEGSGSIHAAFRELQALKAAWSSHADAYLARPDLALLLRKLQ